MRATVLLFFILIFMGEAAAMQYTVQMLPAKVAGALPEFTAKLPDGEATFASKDLIYGKDRSGKYLFGIAERRADPATPLQRKYLFSVDDEGALHATGADTAAGEQIVDGIAARAVLVALAAYRNSSNKFPLASIGWRSTDELVTVMFVPARSDNEKAIIGGATSLGTEIHYEISRSELKVIRTTFAR